MRTLTKPRVALAALAALTFAACGGGDDGDGGGESGGTTTIVAGDLFYEFGGSSTEDGALTVNVGTGEVSLAVDNQGSTLHNIVIEELSDEKVAEAEGGNSDTGTVSLEAGTYTFYCDVEGHREAGMEGTLQAG